MDCIFRTTIAIALKLCSLTLLQWINILGECKALWASATSGRGKAGYVCALRGDACALTAVVEYGLAALAQLLYNDESRKLASDESRTFDTSLAALTSDDTGGDNTTVSTIGSANRRDSPEHLNVSEELESQLAATVKGIVEQVISNLKENMQKEVQALKCTIVTLTRRLSDLEEKLYSANDTTGQSNQNKVPESNTFPVQENVYRFKC